MFLKLRFVENAESFFLKGKQNQRTVVFFNIEPEIFDFLGHGRPFHRGYVASIVKF